MLSSAVATHQSPRVNIIEVLQQSSLGMKDSVAKLYELRDFHLLWSDGEKYNDNARELLSIIRQSDEFGLNPFDYDVELIEYFLEATSVDPKLLLKSDVAFTHAYIKLGAHLNSGKLMLATNSASLPTELLANLNKAVDENEIAAAVRRLQPTNHQYHKLITALHKYRAMEDTQGTISANATTSLKPGDRSEAIAQARKALHVLGDYSNDDLDNTVFDETLSNAVIQFQHRHGLEIDGVLGPKTIRAINEPLHTRIQQLEVNLARIRTLPYLQQERYLVVNIPSFELKLIEDSEIKFQTRVIVGEKKHKTPLVNSEITDVVFNPYWNVPKSIAQNEIVPILQQDPNYLAKHNMQLLGQINDRTVNVNPLAINWSGFNIRETTLRIRQNPGANNSLGKIKFIFPNPHSIYLHDTPARSLFAQHSRALSHGCIRVENPVGLARALLADRQDEQLKNDIDYLASQSKQKSITLKNPIPIYITYMTAWIDEHEIVHLRPDIYHRDSQILAALYNAKH